MEPIIRSASVAAITRQLRRPSTAASAREAAGQGAVTPVTPVQPARQVMPAIVHERTTAMSAPNAAVKPDVPPPDAWEALRKREQALVEAKQALRGRISEQDERERRHAEVANGLLSEARDRGYAEGMAQAHAELEAQREQAANELARQAGHVEKVLGALRTARTDLLEQSGDMVVEIVHAAICRLLGENGATRDAVNVVVQAALRDARDSEQLRVRVHPQDFSLLRDLYDDTDCRIVLQSDVTIELGGCLVETAHGTLDARLELQLQNLRNALMDARRARGGVEAAD